VRTIKAALGYTEGIGLQMGIVGSEDTVEHFFPELYLKVEQGPVCQCVRLRFKKWEHYAAAIYSQRGNGDLELLGIASETPFIDEHPLLVPGQPEVRSYRACFWDGGSENGDCTPISTPPVAR
jgi:hypothetical protein